MELTKEYFEQELGRQLGIFAANLNSDLNKRFEEQTKELKAYTDEQTEKLAVMIEESIRQPHEERLNFLEKDMMTVKTVLSLS